MAGEPRIQYSTTSDGVSWRNRTCSAAPYSSRGVYVTRPPAGSIFVTDFVRQLVAGKGFLFADQGESALRGFEDPVRLYDVRWRD